MKEEPIDMPGENADEATWRARYDEERRRVKASFVLTPDQLDALLGHLETELSRRGCDGTMQLTVLWAVENRIDPDTLCRHLSAFGGHCDDEVIYNVDPIKVFG